jgi:hypothetical protein
MGVSLVTLGFQLPPEPVDRDHVRWVDNNIGEVDFTSAESVAEQLRQTEVMRSQLNANQAEIYGRVVRALNTGERCCLFIPGSGGTGKTFLYRAICYLVRGRGQQILATAWTGNAAALLEGGQTCHSRFGLPVPFTIESSSYFSAHWKQAREIASARAILGDEASIMPGCFLVELDRLIRDFTGSHVPFGGKIVLLSGDFRQTLPVCKGSTRTEIVRQCLNQQALFESEFDVMELNQNMRLEAGQEVYLDWLNRLGNGQLPRFEGLHPDLIELPEEFVLHDHVGTDAHGQQQRRPATEQELIDFVFGRPFNVEASYTEARAIICPLNEDTMKINELVFEQLPGLFISTFIIKLLFLI